MKEINITDIDGFRLGNAQDVAGGTGCTVVICDRGAKAGVSVMGGGPATRETDLLNPTKMVQEVFGICLSGGSAYGLDASTGVMKYLEEKGIGFDVGVGTVPIVSAACLFDLISGDPGVRPDAAMGYEACVNSEKYEGFASGNQGAGTGATVGKFMGIERLMKSGLGSYAVQTGELKVGAVVAVNALGDIFDADTGEMLAGILNEYGTGLDNTREIMWNSVLQEKDVFSGNTTIGCVICNASITKSQCSKLAEMTHDGYARVIRPVHTSVDGDTIFFLAAGDVEVNQDAFGDLASYAMAKAIDNAVLSAESAYGFKAAEDL